jgi:hypothetical protein
MQKLIMQEEAELMRLPMPWWNVRQTIQFYITDCAHVLGIPTHLMGQRSCWNFASLAVGLFGFFKALAGGRSQQSTDVKS